jgi:hypothetical protein
MINLTIIEIPEEDVNPNDSNCILNAFPFMVEDENGARWFGAQTREECENYITLQTINN